MGNPFDSQDPFQSASNINSQLNGSFSTNAQLPNTLPEAVSRLFAPEYFPSYGSFVTTGYNRNGLPSSFSSLEAIHGKMHVWTGGSNGHMSQVPVAAFDPVFWLHHK